MDKAKLRNAIYYRFKPLLPRRFQIWLRHKLILRKRGAYSNIWPILEYAARPPDGWSGWRDQKQFALVLTHDVDTAKGQDKCYQLITLEQNLGFRSSFNFVPDRYCVFPELRHYLSDNGFEVGVHGLNHDGKLFTSKKIFQKRAMRINHYLKTWKSVGFRSPSMHHKIDWIHDLHIEYDASTFDTDPFEPQPDGVGTIFPFWVPGDSNQKGYVELPYTLAQDFTLFVLMKEENVEIWKRKLDWISGNGGMALLNTHPDYMNFDKKKSGLEEYPIGYYVQFLEHIKDEYFGKYWNALPREIARFWSANFAVRASRQCIYSKSSLLTSSGKIVKKSI